MNMLLMQLADLITPANRAAAQAGEGPVTYDKIGFIVLGVIVGPVILLSIAAIFEFPRKSKIPELFLSAFFLLISALVGGFAAIGFVLKFVIPQ